MRLTNLFVALACLLLQGASAGRLLETVATALSEVERAAGRALHQVTDSYVGQGGNQYNNPVQIYAHAREAEAWSHARAIGIYLNQGGTVTTAGDTYPAGRGIAVSQNGQSRGGRARAAGGAAPANPISLFGPTAIATTEQGFRAMSAVNGVPMIDNRPATGSSLSASTGSTTFRWEAVVPRQGTGASRNVFTESLGYTERGPLSNGISENGGGPTAMASAGDAVAMSQADTPENDRFAWGRRRHL
ncbi:MAG: hypothetical protein J3K34DRAFT_463711 [Monoraphidium minutum]|nr:MAG: hypothetical protein J3K34DRAFT_463711 [Monoraphidium minutum]